MSDASRSDCSGGLWLALVGAQSRGIYKLDLEGTGDMDRGSKLGLTTCVLQAAAGSITFRSLVSGSFKKRNKETPCMLMARHISLFYEKSKAMFKHDIALSTFSSLIR